MYDLHPSTSGKAGKSSRIHNDKAGKYITMHTREEKLQAFGRILDVLDELREKCPWDRKQTNESLRPQTIEEVYEPFLVQNGFVARTPRGRVVLPKAYRHVGLPEPDTDTKE